MELKSMKLAPKEKEAPEEVLYAPKPMEYPWGLELRLEEESIAKLGLATLPAAGGEMTLHAKVKVTSVGSYSNDKGEQRTITLQVTDMALGAE